MLRIVRRVRLLSGQVSLTRGVRGQMSSGKFVQRNHSGKIIGGSIFLTGLLCVGIYKKYEGKPDEFFNDEELASKGVFVEDQKILRKNQSILDSNLGLQVEQQWELLGPSGEKIKNSQFKDNYYFLMLEPSQIMIDRAGQLIRDIRQQIDLKYYLSPELESYKNDIQHPIIISISEKAQSFPIQANTNILRLVGDQASIQKSFEKLFIDNYHDKIFVVDGLNGSTLAINLLPENNQTLPAIFILNYLNEASIFRRFLQ